MPNFLACLVISPGPTSTVVFIPGTTRPTPPASFTALENTFLIAFTVLPVVVVWCLIAIPPADCHAFTFLPKSSINKFGVPSAFFAYFDLLWSIITCSGLKKPKFFLTHSRLPGSTLGSLASGELKILYLPFTCLIVFNVFLHVFHTIF